MLGRIPAERRQAREHAGESYTAQVKTASRKATAEQRMHRAKNIWDLLDGEWLLGDCCLLCFFPTYSMSKSAVAARPARQDTEELDLDTTGKSKTKPIASGKYGRIEWALFPQERSRVDGSSYTTLQCVLDKGWVDKEGAWQHRRITLNNPREMMAVRIAMDDAFKALYNTPTEDEE